MRTQGFKRAALLTCGILALLIVMLGRTIQNEIRQQELDRALISAIQAADAQSVHTLLNQGADPDACDTPKRDVSLWGFLRDRLRGLNGATPGTPVLALAVTRVRSPYVDRAAYVRGVTIVKALLDHGARIDVKDASNTGIINLAVESNYDSQILHLLLQRWGDDTHGSRERRATLLHLKNPVNELTALMIAAAWGEPEEIDLLIGAGANVDLQDAHGQTVLMMAVERGRPENIACLLKYHANVRLKDRAGNTALSLARANRAADVTTPFNYGREADFWPNIVKMLEQAR
jgi:hypothetical protein